MPTKRQQIQWIREDINIYETYTREDEQAGIDTRHNEGVIKGLNLALRALGETR